MTSRKRIAEGLKIAAVVFMSVMALLSCTAPVIRAADAGITAGTKKAAVSDISDMTDRPDTGNPDGDIFKIRYLDVGEADAALITYGGHSMLIDGGNVADSNLIVSVLKRENIDYLDYIINSHPHEDHVGGLAGALRICDVGRVLCPVKDYDSKAFRNFIKYAESNGKTLEIPHPGDTFTLGRAAIKILGPVRDYPDANNQSVILRIDYHAASFLFTGDMERDAEQDVLAYWGESELKCDVLKTGHHGSETSSSYPFLRAANPDIAIISAGKNNTYGHPAEAVLSRMRDADTQIYRTDLQGDIVITSDGENISVQTARNQNIRTNPAAVINNHIISNQSAYIGNLRSHKFHLPACVSLPADKNKIYFDSRSEAVAAGYEPCKNCHP